MLQAFLSLSLTEGDPTSPGAIVVLEQFHSTIGMGDNMKRSLGKAALVAAFGVTLMTAQGCGMKWLQSDGDQAAGAAKQGGQGDQAANGSSGSDSGGVTGGNVDAGGSGSGWNGQGVNPNFPGMAQGDSPADLSGFSQSPSEEYLAPGGGIASLSSSGETNRHRAELSKEEKAAMDAGLKDVFFAYDQWALSETGMDVLNNDAKWLKEHPGAVLKVEGHCDERGTTDYNIVLGEKRSKSARNYLVELGISPKQVSVVSYGKERPFCLEHDESCYQQNRRGHVLLTIKKK
jgi:peptidoglycan-associated lipoprotein